MTRLSDLEGLPYFFLSLSFLTGWDKDSVSAAAFLLLKAFISSSRYPRLSSTFFFSSWCIRFSCSNFSCNWGGEDECGDGQMGWGQERRNFRRKKEFVWLIFLYSNWTEHWLFLDFFSVYNFVLHGYITKSRLNNHIMKCSEKQGIPLFSHTLLPLWSTTHHHLLLQCATLWYV